ncbi:MAG TPA: hypothetical protein VD866_02460 [Urbifossiella sp.]|nr:hypothetical protein [Urbifossiella sp.]
MAQPDKISYAEVEKMATAVVGTTAALMSAMMQLERTDQLEHDARRDRGDIPRAVFECMRAAQNCKAMETHFDNMVACFVNGRRQIQLVIDALHAAEFREIRQLPAEDRKAAAEAVPVVSAEQTAA